MKNDYKYKIVEMNVQKRKLREDLKNMLTKFVEQGGEIERIDLNKKRKKRKSSQEYKQEAKANFEKVMTKIRSSETSNRSSSL